MSRWVVFEPPSAAGGDAARHRATVSAEGERTAFLRDGWTTWAFLFPYLWPFRFGLWVTGLLAVAATIVIAILARQPGFELAASGLSILLGILMALEGPGRRAVRRRRRGWREVAVIEARSRAEAESLYFARQSAAAAQGPASALARAPRPPVTPALWLAPWIAAQAPEGA
ncbi:DUF2628 domain-containing protein [Aurantimonas sp. MSK8Z-1]|uniref:DUF2628 domain-containing protein n=1 Tax=Mangrovibrevibacter kandeliae TaxID=2968473 RepID=UPI0021194584|nr:DUF2628 domain-containing protein [Aurantimonas sp. MSK8Z-1]MCW4115012.1 DUF2628 domain-containing protein [Aurantimonas sp. MSK8Z-1]